MSIIYAFLIGGLICSIGQFIMDKFKILPIYVTCLFVVIGGFLDFYNIYDKLIELSGCGALLPISSFGHTIVHNVMKEVGNDGMLGLLTGVLPSVSLGITAATVFAFLASLIFKPKG